MYVKVKVGQGMWWASTLKPSKWLIKAIQDAKDKQDLTKIKKEKILDIVYYPAMANGQYEAYVTLQLKVSKTATGYSYNRETVGVGAPIDLELETVQFSGTVMALSNHPPLEQTESRIVYLSKKYAYPWEYDQIHIGDSFSNGEEVVFEVLEKAKSDTNEVILSDQGKFLSEATEPFKYIFLKAKIKTTKTNGQYSFGEEYLLIPGRVIPLVTQNFTYNDYVITKVE